MLNIPLSETILSKLGISSDHFLELKKLVHAYSTDELYISLVFAGDVSFFNEIAQPIEIRLLFEKYQIEFQKNINCNLLLISLKDSFRHTSPTKRIAELTEFERGLSVWDGVWLTYFYPEIFENYSLDMIGSLYSIECIPTLYKWENRFNLSAINPDSEDVLCAAPIVVRSIPVELSELKDLSKLKSQLVQLTCEIG